MTKKRFILDETFMITDNECMDIINPLMNSKDVAKVCGLLNELNRLAEANEEQGLAIMTYLHDNYYDIWEEVNKELEE